MTTSVDPAILRPPREWLICSACGEKFTSLTPTGTCMACAPEAPERVVDWSARREAWREILRLAGTPERFLSVSPEDPIPPDLADWTGTPWCALILGPNESGKTHAATRVLGELLTTRYLSGLWISSQQALYQMKLEMDEPARTPITERMLRAGVLLLDDLSATRTTPYSIEQLSYVLSERYNQTSPTIVTCDVTMNQFKRAGGSARLVSRLEEVHPETGKRAVAVLSAAKWRQRKR